MTTQETGYSPPLFKPTYTRLGNYPLAVGSRVGYALPKLSGEEIPVTICVAAIFDGRSIFGASDRMLTAGDVQFEPQQTKIIPLTNSIVIMVAGDSGLQSEVIQSVQDEGRMRIDADPSNWWSVGDVVDAYIRHYGRVRFKGAEQAILAPLGLHGAAFIAQQQQMAPQLVTQLATELLNYSIPDVAAIFAGIDITGPHIYVVVNGSSSCQDTAGFAAIGAGRWHATSQFMFAGHTKDRPFPETLLLAYSAKKRAEVAPGVGEGTDMFMVGPHVGSYVQVRSEILDGLEKIYQNTRSAERKLAAKAEKKANHYVTAIIAGSTAKEQAQISEGGDGDAPTN